MTRPEEVPCDRKYAFDLCSGRASRFFLRGSAGFLIALCQECHRVKGDKPDEEITREEYARLALVKEVMSS